MTREDSRCGVPVRLSSVYRSVEIGRLEKALLDTSCILQHTRACPMPYMEDV